MSLDTNSWPSGPTPHPLPPGIVPSAEQDLPLPREPLRTAPLPQPGLGTRIVAEMAYDILLSPDEWEAYAATLGDLEPERLSAMPDDLAGRVARGGLAALTAAEIMQVISSASSFRAVTATLRRLSEEVDPNELDPGASSLPFDLSDLDARTREALLLLLEGRSVHEIAGEMSLDLGAVLDSLARARLLLDRPPKRHLHFSAARLAEIAGHPLFWDRWGTHLDRCARCRELVRAATMHRLGPEPIASASRPGRDPSEVSAPGRLRSKCFALWCILPERIEDMVRRWLSIPERDVREDCLHAMVGSLLRTQSGASAQERFSTFIHHHDRCVSHPEREWAAVIGRFDPCSTLNPAEWNEELASELPVWYGEVLVESLHLNHNLNWESTIQRWPDGRPWQSARCLTNCDTYMGWLADYRGE